MSDSNPKPSKEHVSQVAPLDAAGRAAQKRRNWWLGLALLAFVLLVGLTTFVRLKNSDPSKGGFYYHMGQGTETADETPSLPPGMTPEQAAPPENLSAEPAKRAPETRDLEEPQQ